MRVWKHVISDVTFLWLERRKEPEYWITIEVKDFSSTFLLRFQVRDHPKAAHVAANDCCIFPWRFGSVLPRPGVRGTRWVWSKVGFERALAMFDSVFSSCRMLRGVDNSTIPMICTFLCEIHVFWIVRYSLPVANNLFDVTKGCF